MADPLPLARFLDARSAEDARSKPIADSVNIPLEELSARMAELPPKHCSVLIAGPEPLAFQAAEFLPQRGRRAEIATDFSYGEVLAHSRLWQPNEWLQRHVNSLSDRDDQAAFDAGCGGGRDAVYLAAHGWNVLAADLLPDAIERAHGLAARYLDERACARISWRAADVLDERFAPGDEFGLVTCFHFFDRQLIARAKRWLGPGGILMVEAFTTVRQQQTGKPSSPHRVVCPGELRDLVDDMDIRDYEEGDQLYGHTARVLARKRG